MRVCSVADLGCFSWILIFSIPDPLSNINNGEEVEQTTMKRGGKIN
jgi:hypothetical protein